MTGLGALLFFFLIFPFLESILGRLSKRQGPAEATSHHSMGIVITAYRNWAITVPLVESLLKQDYAGTFHIYVIADHAEKGAYPLTDPRVQVFWPDPALNLKAKSIIYATERFRQSYDYLIVFDADNLAAPGFLQWINRYASLGYTAIQGQRIAKNLDTFYARADAAGEYYKNYTDRELPFRLGSSAVISGSGMAVQQESYLAYLASPEIEQGKHLWKKMLQEDKILQNFLLRRNERIAFAPEAILYDEKVGDAAAVETQRSRWLYSYFQNFPNALGLLRRGLCNLSFNQFWFGLVTIAPPMFIQVLLAAFFALLGLLFSWPLFGLMFLGGVIFLLNIPLSLSLSRAPQVVRAVFWKLPLFAWRQLRALAKMGNPDKNFKHTEHRKVLKIEEIDRGE